MDDLKVNDGGGLLDNYGLIDSLIVDCNNLPKALVSGQYVLFCNTIVQMVQKLGSLKTGVKNDMDAKDERIKELGALCDEVAEKAYGVPVDKGVKDV